MLPWEPLSLDKGLNLVNVSQGQWDFFLFNPTSQQNLSSTRWRAAFSQDFLRYKNLNFSVNTNLKQNIWPVYSSLSSIKAYQKNSGLKSTLTVLLPFPMKSLIKFYPAMSFKILENSSILFNCYFWYFLWSVDSNQRIYLLYLNFQVATHEWELTSKFDFPR